MKSLKELILINGDLCSEFWSKDTDGWEILCFKGVPVCSKFSDWIEASNHETASHNFPVLIKKWYFLLMEPFQWWYKLEYDLLLFVVFLNVCQNDQGTFPWKPFP